MSGDYFDTQLWRQINDCDLTSYLFTNNNNLAWYWKRKQVYYSWSAENLKYM